MHIDLRIALTLLCHALLMFIVGEVNRLLAPFHLHLMVDAMYLIFPALFFRVWPGMLVTALTAAALFALRPMSYTFGVLLFPLVTLFATRVRIRIRRENPRHLAVVTLGINTVLFAIYTLNNTIFPTEPSWWLRLGSDYLLSQIIILMIASPWANLQRRLLYTFGIDVGAELQHI